MMQTTAKYMGTRDGLRYLATNDDDEGCVTRSFGLMGCHIVSLLKKEFEDIAFAILQTLNISERKEKSLYLIHSVGQMIDGIFHNELFFLQKI